MLCAFPFGNSSDQEIILLHWIAKNFGTKPVTAYFVIQAWMISLMSGLVYAFSHNHGDVHDEELRKLAIECEESKNKELTNDRMLEKITTLLQTQEEKIRQILNEFLNLNTSVPPGDSAPEARNLRQYRYSTDLASLFFTINYRKIRREQILLY